MGCNLSYDFEPSNRMTKRTGVNQALKNGIRKYLEVSVLILGLNKTGIGVPLVRAYVRFFFFTAVWLWGDCPPVWSLKLMRIKSFWPSVLVAFCVKYNANNEMYLVATGRCDVLTLNFFFFYIADQSSLTPLDSHKTGLIIRHCPIFFYL